MTAVSFFFIEARLDWGRRGSGFGVLVHLLRGPGSGEWFLGEKVLWQSDRSNFISH